MLITFHETGEPKPKVRQLQHKKTLYDNEVSEVLVKLKVATANVLMLRDPARSRTVSLVAAPWAFGLSMRVFCAIQIPSDRRARCKCQLICDMGSASHDVDRPALKTLD